MHISISAPVSSLFRRFRPYTAHEKTLHWAAILEKTMTMQLNGTEFTAVETRTFAPAFEGAQARREKDAVSLMARRYSRRNRRENRAL